MTANVRRLLRCAVAEFLGTALLLVAVLERLA